MNSALRFAIPLMLLAVWGCQNSLVSTVWSAPELKSAKFSKVVAIVVNATQAERRAAEDQMASELRNAQGIPAYTIIPDADLKDKAKVQQVLKEKGIDGAVILRLVAADKQSTYYPPSYSSGYEFYGYQTYDMYSPGYTVTTTTVHAEISIYSVADGKLLWAGASSTNDPANVKDLVKSVAKGVAAELSKARS